MIAVTTNFVHVIFMNCRSESMFWKKVFSSNTSCFPLTIHLTMNHQPTIKITKHIVKSGKEAFVFMFVNLRFCSLERVSILNLTPFCSLLKNVRPMQYKHILYWMLFSRFSWVDNFRYWNAFSTIKILSSKLQGYWAICTK